MYTKTIISSVLLAATVNGAAIQYRREPNIFGLRSRRDVASIAQLLTDINNVGNDVGGLANGLLAILPSDIAAPASSIVAEVTQAVASDFTKATGFVEQFVPPAAVVPTTPPIASVPAGALAGAATGLSVSTPSVSVPLSSSTAASFALPGAGSAPATTPDFGSLISSVLANMGSSSSSGSSRRAIKRGVSDVLQGLISGNGGSLEGLASSVIGSLPTDLAGPASSLLNEVSSAIASATGTPLATVPAAVQTSAASVPVLGPTVPISSAAPSATSPPVLVSSSASPSSSASDSSSASATSASSSASASASSNAAVRLGGMSGSFMPTVAVAASVVLGMMIVL